MSNDAKLWGWRVTVFIMLSVDSSILMKAITGGGAKQAVSPPWFVIFFIVCALNIPVYIWYKRAKNDRWSDARKTPEQLQVEILAAAAKNGVLPPKKPEQGAAQPPTTPAQQPQNPGEPPKIPPQQG
jgi:hypothetical protein